MALDLTNLINDYCDLHGRRGSIVTPVFPVGWEEDSLGLIQMGVTLEEIPKCYVNDYKRDFFKYTGFKGTLLWEVSFFDVRFANVEIMGKEVFLPVNCLEFIVEKDAREEATAEVYKQYKQYKQKRSSEEGNYIQ